MSDFSSSSPVPVGNTPSVKPREGGQQHAPPRDHTGQGQQNAPETPPAKSADAPAVSVAATVAGIHAGDRFSGPIVGVDADGHPIFETPKGRFVINPTAGLETHIRAEILITQVEPQIEGRLVARNGVRAEPPVEVALTLIATRGDAAPDDTTAPTATAAAYPRLARTTALPIGLLPVESQALANALVQKFNPATTDATPVQPKVLSAFSSALLGEQATPFITDDLPTSVSGLVLGEQIRAVILGQDAPQTPFEATVGALEQQELDLAVIAISRSETLSPIAAPQPGTPLAILADHGRLATFIVEDSDPALPTTLSLKHAGLRIALSVDQPLEPGTKVTVLLLPPAIPPGLAAVQFPLLAPQDWPVGEALLQQGAGGHIPAFGPKLTNGALFLWQALNAGSADAWLGAAARDALHAKGQQDLLTALQRDFTTLSEAQRGGSEWRPLPFPVQGDGNLQLLSWFIRPLQHLEEKEEGGNTDPKQRDGGQEFVVDARFDGFGRLRFHGEVSRSQLNLNITSALPLPDGLKASTGQLFRNILDAQGMTGLLRFHTGAEQDYLPL